MISNRSNRIYDALSNACKHSHGEEQNEVAQEEVMVRKLIRREVKEETTERGVDHNQCLNLIYRKVTEHSHPCNIIFRWMHCHPQKVILTGRIV
jgi:hypothetical protein